jgi:hypothetical protein
MVRLIGPNLSAQKCKILIKMSFGTSKRQKKASKQDFSRSLLKKVILMTSPFLKKMTFGASPTSGEIQTDTNAFLGMT